MLNETQLKHLELFGFVILKNIFTPKELEFLRSEFEIACKNNELKQGPYDNTYRYMSMLGKDTPFYASLIEDPRFYKPITQWFGEKSFGFEIHSYRYVNDTRWHYNDGSPNIYGYGAKYQFPLYEPVTAQTGSLRFLPGSHKDPWQSELRQWWPFEDFKTQEKHNTSQAAMEIIDSIPYCPAECELGDAVLFDLRIMHSTWGGGVDRNVSCISYFHYPESPEEFATMKKIIPSHWGRKDRWDQEEFDYFFSNPNKSPIRQKWIHSYDELLKLSCNT